MKLVVALGNCEPQYHQTRHNIGFDAIDFYCQHKNYNITEKNFKSLIYKTPHFIIAKPQTYMNLSGLAVKEIIHYYKIKPEDVVVIYDDIYLKLGLVKVKKRGSAAGHKGMQNIIDHLRTDNIARIRIGVGNDQGYNLSTWVLSKFTKSEWAYLSNTTFPKAMEVIDIFLNNGILESRNEHS